MNEVENKHLILCKDNHSFKGVLKKQMSMTLKKDEEKSCKYILDAYHRKKNMYKYLFETISDGVENYVCLFSQSNLICKCSMFILFIKYSVKIIKFDSLNICFTRINSLDNVDIIHDCVFFIF